MSHSTKRVLLGAIVIIAGVVGLFLLAWGPASDRDVSNLGPDEFVIASRTVREAAPDGPIFLPDPIDEGRDLYVTHTGDDPNSGYLAFSARGPSGCLLELDRDAIELVDTCDGTRYPPTGDGLEPYPVRVGSDRLSIDVNFAERDEPISPTTTGEQSE